MKIAIIGGGFSGTSLAAQIIAKNTHPISLYMIEKGPFPGLGVAYSTPFACHLLNVRANQMGLLHDEPDGFYKWLLANEEIWRHADPAFETLSFNADDFLPRKLYGIYLSDMLTQIKIWAEKQGSTFQILHKHALDIESSNNAFKINLGANETLEVHKVVLAMGTQIVKHHPFEINSPRYISNIWDYNPKSLQNLVDMTNDSSTVFIIGTGLTMIDMVSTLQSSGYKGKIIALSLHGQLPCAHVLEALKGKVFLPKFFKSSPLVRKVALFHAKQREILKKAIDWRLLIDCLRSFTPALWRGLSLIDKKRFLRHLLSMWNKHRHRMAPASALIIEHLQRAQRLQILAGKIVRIEDDQHNLKVIYEEKGQGIFSLPVDFVFNCTGPEYAFKKQHEAILHNLWHKGWLCQDDLGLGIKVNSDCSLEGEMAKSIFAIGPVLYGEHFESTAVPEIRRQAMVVAARLRFYTKERFKLGI